MSVYNTAYDLSLPDPVDNTTALLAAQGNAWSDAIYNIEHAVGLAADTASSTGTIYARLAALEASAGGIFKQTTAPSSPATDDLWIDTSTPTRPLTDFYSAAWHLVGANALTIRGLAVDTAAPTDGQVATWVNADSKIEWKSPTGGTTNPLTAAYDLFIGGTVTGGVAAPARLGIGSVGQALGVVAGPALGYVALNFISNPGSIAEGGLPLYTSGAWSALNPGGGTSGYALTSNGPGAAPSYQAIPVSPPGSGMALPASPRVGAVISYDETATPYWLLPGSAGQVLTAHGDNNVVGSKLTWATPTAGFSNPLTVTGDIIYSSSGSTAARLGIGSTGQGLVVSSGAPSWTTINPMTTQDDLIVGGASGAVARLAKGSDSQVLTISASTHHVVWANNSAGFADPTSARGDLIYHGATGTTRLPLGTSTFVLTSDGTDAAWAALPTDTDYYQTVAKAGSAATQRPTVNLIDGTGMSVTVADNSGSSRTDVTVTARWSHALAFA